MSAILVCILMVIAAIVSFYQIKQEPKKAWPWIIAYWLILTIKNLVDFLVLV